MTLPDTSSNLGPFSSGGSSASSLGRFLGMTGNSPVAGGSGDVPVAGACGRNTPGAGGMIAGDIPPFAGSSDGIALVGLSSGGSGKSKHGAIQGSGGASSASIKSSAGGSQLGAVQVDGVCGNAGCNGSPTLSKANKSSIGGGGGSPTPPVKPKHGSSGSPSFSKAKSVGKKKSKSSRNTPPSCSSKSGLEHNSGNVPVFPPGQSKPKSRFSLRRLFYANPLLSPPFPSAGGSGAGCGGSRSRSKTATISSSGAGKNSDDSQSEGGGSWSGVRERPPPLGAVDRESLAGGGGFGHDSPLAGLFRTSGSVLHNPETSSVSSSVIAGDPNSERECPLCLAELTLDQFPQLRNCYHLACVMCLQLYIKIEVQEGRANLKCPQCTEQLHPNDIETLIADDRSLLQLYQFLMVRRVLAADPDTRWCPAPNCTFAVVASGCASCPKIDCEREGCDFSFCYHCKAEWHPNQTCDMARAQRQPLLMRSSRVSFSQDSGLGPGSELKVCPRCSVLIVKMDDGSCNHMTCAVCGSEFCWLCMKEISDLHYLSPSGCTFWGKKPWSRKKKLLWQLGTLVGAPVGIALIAGISVPALIIGIPVWVGRKIYSAHRNSNRLQRVLAIGAGVFGSILVSPILAGLAVSIGVPVLLAYVYGVVPISLCRSGGCGVRTTTQGVRIDIDEDVPYTRPPQPDQLTSSSRVANPSIGEVSLGASLSLGSATHLDRLTECDRESASNTAVAGYSLTGSVASSYLGQHRLEVGADIHSRKKLSFSSERLSETVSLSEKSATVSLGDNDGSASTRALAGSILHYRIGYGGANGGSSSGVSGSVHVPSGGADALSVSSYRMLRERDHSAAGGGTTPGSYTSSAAHSQNDAGEQSLYRQDGESGAYPSGDEISLRSLPAVGSSHHRSLSPVSCLSGDELNAAIRRSSRRRGMDKQYSENSSLVSGDDQEVSVRFDTNVSYLEAGPAQAAKDAAAMELERSRLNLKKCDLDKETLREETAEELAQVISPQVGRAEAPQLISSGTSSPCLLSPSDESPLLPMLHRRSVDSRNVSLVSVEPTSNITNISIEPESLSGTFTSDPELPKGSDNVGYQATNADSPTALSIPVGGSSPHFRLDKVTVEKE